LPEITSIFLLSKQRNFLDRSFIEYIKSNENNLHRTKIRKIKTAEEYLNLLSEDKFKNLINSNIGEKIDHIRQFINDFVDVKLHERSTNASSTDDSSTTNYNVSNKNKDNLSIEETKELFTINEESNETSSISSKSHFSNSSLMKFSVLSLDSIKEQTNDNSLGLFIEKTK